MSNNTQKGTKVYDISSQADIFNFETIDTITGSDDVTDIALSTNHKSGKYSVSFDKDGTTETTGVITIPLGKANGKNLNIFAIHKLMLKLYLSATTNVSSISVALGTDASNNNVYTSTTLASGWNEFIFNCDSPSAVNGDGIDWYGVKYLAVTVTFAGAGNTLTGILVDTAYLFKSNTSGASSSSSNIEQIKGVDLVADNAAAPATDYPLPVGGQYNSSLPTYTDGDRAMVQFDVNGKLLVSQSADIEIGAVEIKDGTTDARQAVKVDNATATATPSIALIGGHYKATLDTYDDNDASPLHVDANGQLIVTDLDNKAILTTIDADTGAIQVNTGVIAADTTSIDGKTPALGTAAMAASSPSTIATDDTQFGPVGAAADVDGNLHGQLRYIGEQIDSLNAAATPFFDSDADNVKTVLSASPSYLNTLTVTNINAVDCWIQLYDAAVGDVTVGTTTPTLSYLIPAGDGTASGAFTKEFNNLGMIFSTAITYACTTEVEGSTDPSVGLVLNAGYTTI